MLGRRWNSVLPKNLHDHNDKDNNHNNDNDDESKSKRAMPFRIIQAILAKWRRLSIRQRCLLLKFIILLLPYSIHRSIVHYKTSKTWVLSPSMFVERPCPLPAYPTLKDNDNQKLKICLTTLTDQQTQFSVMSIWRKLVRWRNYDNMLQLTWPSKQMYAKQHGYHLYDMSYLMDHSRPAPWSKIKAVQHLLTHEQCDWVHWMDADTLVMNSSKRLQDFLPATHDLVVAVDYPNQGYNSGSWTIRNSKWSRDFLQNWWDATQFVRLPGQGKSGDNDAFKFLLANLSQEDFDQHVAVPSRCQINPFAKFLRPFELQELQIDNSLLKQQPWYLSENFYHKGDWLVHVPGYDNKEGTIKLLLPEMRNEMK